jgi:hypothetical protein
MPKLKSRIHMVKEQGVPEIGGQWNVYFGNTYA